MVYKSPFRNEHIELYLQGKLDEIPAESLPYAKAAAEARVGAKPQSIDLPADASEEQEPFAALDEEK
jgi:hypothetical protein